MSLGSGLNHLGVDLYKVQDKFEWGGLSSGSELGKNKLRFRTKSLVYNYIRIRTNIPGVDLVKVKSWEWMSLGLGLNHLGYTYIRFRTNALGVDLV